MLPAKKTSKTRTRTRRSHHAIKSVRVVPCPKCGNSKLRHAACENCGYATAKVALPVKTEE